MKVYQSFAAFLKTWFGSNFICAHFDDKDENSLRELSTSFSGRANKKGRHGFAFSNVSVSSFNLCYAA